LILGSRPAISRRAQKGNSYKKVDCILSGYDIPWFRSFLAHDPRLVLAQVKCPALLVFEERDLQVPAEDHLPAMVQALLQGNHNDFSVKTFPGANHLFQAAATGSPAEYERLPKEFVPGFLEFLSAWLSLRIIPFSSDRGSSSR